MKGFNTSIVGTKVLLDAVKIILPVLFVGLSACGGGDDVWPTLEITMPTPDGTYSTVWVDLRVGGTVTGSSSVSVKNTLTDITTGANVNPSSGTWVADIKIEPGENLIIVTTAGGDKYSPKIAQKSLIVFRPSEPARSIINGVDAASTNTFWVDGNSFAATHMIALYEDGTAKVTTGNIHTEAAGPVVDTVWNLSGPDSIQIIGCPSCSYQSISRISGSLNEENFLGEPVTVGVNTPGVLHSFYLSVGKL